jgi:hypothetical protein
VSFGGYGCVYRIFSFFAAMVGFAAIEAFVNGLCEFLVDVCSLCKLFV